MKPEEVVSQCTWLPIFCYHHDHHDHHDRHDNLVPSECPGAKLHNAGLLVEREVGHIYRTGRLQIIVIIMIVISFLMRMIEVINNMRVIVKLVVGHVYRTKRLRQTLTFS